MTIADVLKTEIAKAETLQEVAKGSGVPYGNLWHFVHSDTDMQLHNLQRLADYFGFRLVKQRGAAKKKTRRKV